MIKSVKDEEMAKTVAYQAGLVAFRVQGHLFILNRQHFIKEFYFADVT
jgi:hypothetical protein